MTFLHALPSRVIGTVLITDNRRIADSLSLTAEKCEDAGSCGDSQNVTIWGQRSVTGKLGTAEGLYILREECHRLIERKEAISICVSLSVLLS